MLSLFYKILENKIPENISVIIIKPYKEKQIILIKGKFGQFMLNWSILNNICNSTIWIQKFAEQTNIKKENTNALNVNDNFLTFKKENKLFIYNKKLNKINNVICLKWTTKQNIFTKIKTIYNQTIDKNLLLNKTDYLGYKIWLNKIEKLENKIYIGYITPLKNIEYQNAGISSTLKNKDYLDKQIKNIFKGLIQGFSINLELKGIGYIAKLVDLINLQNTANYINLKNCLHINKNWICINNQNNIGYYESNINKIKKTAYFGVSKNKTLSKIKNWNDKNIILETNNILNKKLYILQNKNLFINKFNTYNYLKIKKKNTEKINKNIIIRLGTSHNIIFPLYKYELYLKISQNINTTLTLFGLSRTTLKNIAAKIILLKKPEPYKGKGIRYDGEKLLLKKN